ncbi:MAG: glycosyltransferase [Parcubacteria group bacterium Gr01-1014_31]|nr:MAG: glycosyltransferase [Parcubacteria group bacterium Gr01-1014_31]
MKVCLINNLYPPDRRGGAEVMVEAIAVGLRELGYEVVVIALGRQRAVERGDRMTVYRIRPFNIFSFFSLGDRPLWLRLPWHLLDLFGWSGRLQVKRVLKAERPALVLTHNLKGVSYLIPRLLRDLGIKHIHTLHDIQLSRPSGLLISGQEKPFLVLDLQYEKWCRYLFGSPTVVVAPSHWVADYHRTRGFFRRSRWLVMPNPLPRLDPAPPAVREHPGDHVNLLYLGQLERGKGILLLLEVMEGLPRTNWTLRIVGTGSLSEEVRVLTADKPNYRYLGYVKRSGLRAIFNQTDATVVPSLCYENSPTVIAESFSCGVPVVAADIGGISELVKDNVNGFTFAPSDPRSLRAVLLQYLDHPELLAPLREGAARTRASLDLKMYLQKMLEAA